MKKTNQIAVKALLVALLVIVVVSMVACNTTPPDDTPGSGGIGDLSKEEVLGENNVDTSLKEYSANIENLIYETYKTGYIQYAEFVNENRIDELDTEVPALEDLDENVKSILDFIRTTLRDSYMSEKAVENLCNYLIQKAPDVRNKVQSVFDEINKNMSENDKEDDYDEDGSTQGSSWLETLYTTDNVKYVSDLYSDLVKLTGAEPMSRIVFELGKVTLNNLIENYSKELEERISERDEYLESIGMSLADFNSYGKAYYNNEWRYKHRLREERKIPSEYDIENALENGYITEDKANELLAQNKQLEQEVKAYVLQEKAKYLSYETQYPELKERIIIDSSYGEYWEYARYYYYSRILNLQEDLAYLTSVVDLLESDSIVNELMPDAINTMMSVMQIAPSVIEVRLSATALTNDILDEITKGDIDSFNVKKQDYVDNFATYKNAIVKLVESYENLNWDSLVTICDKVVSYYENGTFALPDDNYNITSKIMTAIRPALNAIKGKNVIGTAIKWVKRAIEATTVDDLNSLDYPTYTSNGYVYDYAMATEYDYRTNTQTTYVRLLPERMHYSEMNDEGYNGSWAKENPTKVFEDEDALKAWQKDYGKSMYDSYSNYVSEDDYDSDGMRIKYVVELDNTTLDSEIDSNIIDEAILDGTAKIFYENKSFAQWKKQNPDLVYNKYISGEAQYYFDFIFTSDTITDEDTLMDTDVYYVAVLDERMSLYDVIEMIGGATNIDTWIKNNYTMTFDSEDALDAWYASSGLVYAEQISGTSDYYYDYIKTQIDSTLYIVELDERKSYTELNAAGCFDNTWIMANATQTFELWKEFNEWKSNNPNRFEGESFFNYDYTEKDGMVYIITYNTPAKSSLSNSEIVEKANISFPRYAKYYSWKHNGGYLYDEYDQHFYVNGQEVSESEYDLAQKRMLAKALQIVVRMTDSNKEEIKAYINDYAKYMDDITKAVEPLYIDYPASETVTFEQFYSAFAKIKDINTQTMTEAQFEAYLDEFEEVAEKYLLYIIPYFMHVVGC